MLKRNENFAALTLVNPVISPVEIVKPEREKPGNIANPCAKPIKAAFFQFIVPLFLFCCDKYSAKNRINPVPIKNIDVI